MKTIHVRRSVCVFGIAFGVMLSGCGLLNAGKPVVVITSPPSGTQVDVNTEVQVQVNATDDQGIVRIDLLVNGAVAATEVSPQATGQPIFNAVLRYTPKSPGAHVVDVRAYNRKGDASTPVSINLQVRDAQALATGTPAPSPTPTPLSSNPTAITPTAAAPATSAPPPAITIVVQPPPPQQPTVPAAPNKPSDFKADGTGTTIAFTWDDKATNELGFRIYQVGEVAPIITLPTHTGTGGMSSNWTGRPCNFSASFYIRAYNDAGESGSSNSDGAVTIPCPAEIFQATGSGTTINFTWNDKATNESGFRIYQESVPAPVVTRPANSGQSAVNYSWTGQPCNVFAQYFVRAYNSAGESLSSNNNGAATTPCAPSGLRITNMQKILVEFQFTDNSTNETGFHVYRDDILFATLPSHLGPGTVNGAQGHNCSIVDRTHVYSVRAYNEAGDSQTSEHVGATIPHC